MERCFYAFLQYGAHCIWFGGSFDAHHLFAQGILIEYYIMNDGRTVFENYFSRASISWSRFYIFLFLFFFYF